MVHESLKKSYVSCVLRIEANARPVTPWRGVESKLRIPLRYGGRPNSMVPPLSVQSLQKTMTKFKP